MQVWLNIKRTADASITSISFLSQTKVSSTMEELEANPTQTALVLESEGDKENLYENRNQGSQVDGLINDAADEEPNLKGRIQEAEKLAAKISQEKLELIEDIAQRKVC